MLMDEPSHAVPVTRRVVRAVGLIDGSTLANPLFTAADLHALQDELVAHHRDHPDLPLRTVASLSVRERAQTALRALPKPARHYDAHDLIDAVQTPWLALLASWTPLTTPTQHAATPAASVQFLARRLVAWADADRDHWRASGYLPWLAAVYVHSYRPADPAILSRYEQRCAAEGDHALVLSMQASMGPLNELVPGVRKLLELAEFAAVTAAGQAGDF